ncbi:MAG: response regulator [Proteobacteria bacterium]|nr:response regulator [Pseudomonadota bacterium]
MAPHELPSDLTALEARRLRALQRLVPAAALVSALVALTTLAAWVVGDALTQLRLPYVYILKFPSAAMLLLLAVALFGHWRNTAGWRTASLACAVLAAALALLTLAEYLLPVDLGLDRFLVHDYADMRFPGRTAPLAAVYTLMMSVAFLLPGSRRQTRFMPWLVFLASGIPLMSLGGYAYHAPPTEATSLGPPLVALQAAACRILLCAGALFLRPDSELVRLLVSESLAGSMARRLLPLALGLPILLGALVVTGQRSGWLSGSLGFALLVSSCALLFATAVWLTTFLLLKEERTRATAEERRLQAEALVRAGQQRLQIALSTARLGTWELDILTGELEASAQCKTNFGLPAEAPLAYAGMLRSVLPADRATLLAAIDRSVAQRTDYHTECRIHWPDGSIHWLVVSGRTLLDEAQRPHRIVGVTLDVTERKQAEENLRQADQQKDVFLATLAHELRNPLAPIRQAAQIARSAGATQAQRNWGLDVIDRQAANMALLLNDLLDVSRITRGQLALRKESVDLATIIDTAIETARPLIHTKHHHVHVDLPAAPLHVTVDPLRIAQVLANLLTNAAKYSDANGQIWVSARAEGDTLHLSVRDAGIGIEPDMLPRVFTMFSQAQAALERADGGLGIGLALVKGLVELHGGTVSVDSPGARRGSTFTVRLPGAVVRAGGAAPEMAAGPARGGQPRLRVLIADDNKDAAESLKVLLELEGHEVRSAHDGMQALEAAAAFRPDVIFLDIGMPGLTGYEVAERLRALDPARTLRLIALTGWGQPEDRARSAAAGFDHHLTKPIDFQVLAELLAHPARRAAPDGHPHGTSAAAKSS